MCRFGVIREIEAEPMVGDKDYAGTKKLTWLPRCDGETAVPVECVEIAPLITTKSVPKEDGAAGLEKAAAPVPRRSYVLPPLSERVRRHRVGTTGGTQCNTLSCGGSKFL